MLSARAKLGLLAAFGGVVATLVATTPVEHRAAPSPPSSVSSFDSSVDLVDGDGGDGLLDTSASDEGPSRANQPGTVRTATPERGDGPASGALVEALIEIESNGDPNAIGDGGRAVGVLQIHPIMVDEVNRILQRQVYTRADRLDPQRSVEMFWIYTNHYSPNASAEVIARRWNGGPDGDTEPATTPYWQKVKHALETRQEAASRAATRREDGSG